MTIPKSRSFLFVTSGGSCVLALLGMSIMFLHASIFDYRFGFATISACVMGLAAGIAATRYVMKKPTLRNNGVWFALAGFSAVLNACTFFIVPFGSTGNYLFVTSLVTLPFGFWVTGLMLLKQEQNIPNHRFLGVMFLGAGIGIIISFYFVTQSSSGPLFLAWLAAGGLIFLAMTVRIRPITLVISSLSLILLGVTGSFHGWNFKVPPHWASDDGYLVKPYYAEAALNNSMVSVATRWDTLARMDVAYDKKTDANLGLVFKNGALIGLLPFDRSKNVNSDQSKKDFPLVALPLLAGQPHDILLINSSLGLEIKMAAVDFGVSRIHDMQNNFALKALVEQHQEIYGPLINNPNIKLTYGNVRNALRRDNTIYDQIYLTIPQNKVPGWTETGISENYLYTREALRDYWAHLKPGGVLVVLSGEEILYMRALLAVWDILKEDRAWGNNLLIRQAWGYRKYISGIEPYHYLLMLSKGPISDETAKRINELTKNLILEELFGPNQLPPGGTFNISQHPYYILHHPQGLEIAKKALGEYMTWKLKAPVDTDTPTDRHPNFFQVAVDMEVLLKWLLGICVVLLAYLYLFPLEAERCLKNPAISTRPPLPVHLSYFLALGAGSMMTLVALSFQTILFADNSNYSLAAVMIAMMLGTGTAVSYRWHVSNNANHWRWFALAAATLSCLLYWILINVWGVASGWPMLVRLSSIAAAAYPAGLFATLLLIHGLKHLKRHLPPLFPWAIVTFGVAAEVGVIAAFWLGQYWGWGVVWASIAGCYLVVLGAGLYATWAAAQSEMKQIPAQS